MVSMSQKRKEADREVMARLRKPIDDLVDRHCSDKSSYQRLRLRQLAWQAVDVLVRTGSVADIEHEKDIKRIIRDIREIGASEKFIEESLALAVSIYKRMQVYYPGLLERYRG